MIKNILIGAAVILGIAGVFMPVGDTQTTVVERLGAMAGPDLPYKYINIGGVGLYTQSSGLTQATNTVLCAMQSPAGTSTLVSASVQLNSATGTLTSLWLTKSASATNPGTSAANIASSSVTSGAQKSLYAASSTWNAQAYADRQFPPNTFLLAGNEGGGILNMTGSCEAIWHMY